MSNLPEPQRADLVIVGAGAAGLTAAIFAGEAAADSGRRILLLDGAKKPGAKILVSGGGRCNVTNTRVTPEDYFGGRQPIIRSVLKAFDERTTLDWMESLGVELKLEPTGKYFPVTDSARTVLEALTNRVAELGIGFRTGVRVTAVRRVEGGFRIELADESSIEAGAVILATGGYSLPKSGSDGAGIAMARRLGHTLVPTTPALVPLMLGDVRDAVDGRAFSGLTIEARLSLIPAAGGKALYERTASLLFTHFGLSGPAALDISRHYLRARLEEQDVVITLGHPEFPTVQSADEWWREQIAAHPKRLPATALGEKYPERLAGALAPDATSLAQLKKERRLELAKALAALPLNVVGDRGYSFAETTAGGIDVREIDSATMASRKVPGLFLCGEMLDVDGRIGGFNFQWAWATGYLAGNGAMRHIMATT